jgi:hypothetical protein
MAVFVAWQGFGKDGAPAGYYFHANTLRGLFNEKLIEPWFRRWKKDAIGFVLYAFLTAIYANQPVYPIVIWFHFIITDRPACADAVIRFKIFRTKP